MAPEESHHFYRGQQKMTPTQTSCITIREIPDFFTIDLTCLIPPKLGYIIDPCFNTLHPGFLFMVLEPKVMEVLVQKIFRISIG